MNRKITAAAGAAVLMVALSGCMKLHNTSTFHSDNTVDQHVIIAMDLEVFGEESAIAPSDFENEVPADIKDRVTVKEYSDDQGLQGVDVTITKMTLDEFNSGDLLADSNEVTGTGNASVVREGDEFVVTLPAAGASEPEGAEEFGMDSASILSAIDFKTEFIFPGEVISASAGTINGNTVTLTGTDLLVDDDIVIRANATSGGAVGAWLWVVLGLVGLVVIGVVVAIIVISSRKKNTAEPGSLIATEYAVAPEVPGAPVPTNTVVEAPPAPEAPAAASAEEPPAPQA